MKIAPIILNAGVTVNEAVEDCPATLTVFQTFGIDSCCGGPLPIGEAASRHGHEVDVVLAALESVRRM